MKGSLKSWPPLPPSKKIFISYGDFLSALLRARLGLERHVIHQ